MSAVIKTTAKEASLPLYSEWQHGAWASKWFLPTKQTTNTIMALGVSLGCGYRHGLHLGSRAMDTSMALEAAQTMDINMVLGGNTEHEHGLWW